MVQERNGVVDKGLVPGQREVVEPFVMAGSQSTTVGVERGPVKLNNGGHDIGGIGREKRGGHADLANPEIVAHKVRRFVMGHEDGSTGTVHHLLAEIPKVFFSYVAIIQSELPPGQVLEEKIPELQNLQQRFMHLEVEGKQYNFLVIEHAVLAQIFRRLEKGDHLRDDPKTGQETSQNPNPQHPLRPQPTSK